MDEYYGYLAAHVLNEREIVTYRTLSRALKVHVNIAKQMLCDFHHRQNSKKPGTVHATYLLSGQRKSASSTSTKSTQSKDEDDTIIDSSPGLPGSSMPEAEDPQTVTRSILLVKEHHLEQAKSTFVQLTGIHIYSLQSERLSDFQSLTECTRKIFAMLRTEDPLETGKVYGTIQNANVRRRSRKTPIPPAPASKSVPASTKPGIPAVKKEDKLEPVEPASKTESTKIAPAKSTPKPATLKKQNSDIMSSFAKNPPKKAKAPEAQKEVEAPEDTEMTNLSDEEPNDGAEEAEIAVKAPSGKSKQDRQAELEAMMDVEEDDMEEADEQEAGSIGVQAPEPELEPEKDTVTVENGRRRGRRKVTKKRTVRDEEGYLVTKEEAVWESFSEDEPAPKKPKTSQAPIASANKKGGKPGQGNIMAFFGKK